MWVKICGVTDVGIARQVASLSPDAIGLNFYAGSKRRVSEETAKEIVSQLPESVMPVGLFVNHSHEQIRSICSRCEIRTIQLHGDESPEFVAELGEFQIIRAFRVGSGEAALRELDEKLSRYAELGVSLFACLVDAHVPGAYGGTGQRAPWGLLRDGWKSHWPKLVLAGGLEPENVGDACLQVRPWGVDVASGVEAAPGRQNPTAVQQFIGAARDAATSEKAAF